MRYAAFLRAVNVAGQGKLPMADLRALALTAGFERVATYIQSGNLVFEADLPLEEVSKRLNAGLEGYFGRPACAFLRRAEDVWAMEAALPFRNAPGNQVGCLIVDNVPETIEVAGIVDEVIVPGDGVIFVYFPNGMGRSKLDMSAFGNATMRNANTLRRVADMLRGM